MTIGQLVRACAASGALVVASSITAAGLPPHAELNLERFAHFCPHSITQSFPTAGPAETTWLICWREVAGSDSLADPNGLVIGPVYFRKSPSAPFVSVLWDMRVSDYFVPYHTGSPRYYDLSTYNFTLTAVNAADCPAPSGAPISAHVCKEIRDRGLMWKDFTGVRRGEELVLWGAIDAANYRYIQEYTFRDDGTILGWEGATGQNLPGREHEPHVHNAIWRLDIDLDGAQPNTAMRMSHSESPGNAAGTATDHMSTIATAQGFGWQPATHDAVQVTNATFKNAQGNLASYVLMPLVTGGGLTRHFEPFTHEDFWVTPYSPLQFAASQLPAYIAPHPSVKNTDLVVWYKGSLHHHPRDEDGVYSPQGPWVGTAHVMWTGFMLMPYDLFDCSPFYKPCP